MIPKTPDLRENVDFQGVLGCRTLPNGLFYFRVGNPISKQVSVADKIRQNLYAERMNIRHDE